MKNYRRLIVCLAALMIIFFSCKKDPYRPKPPVNVPDRSILFVLYTTQDFSDDADTITFTMTIRNQDRVIWDSVLPAMRIKDIPKQANKFQFVKQVPGDDGSKVLTVGFLYEIKNIGMSWYLDTCNVGNPIKLINYDFH